MTEVSGVGGGYGLTFTTGELALALDEVFNELLDEGLRAVCLLDGTDVLVHLPDHNCDSLYLHLVFYVITTIKQKLKNTIK